MGDAAAVSARALQGAAAVAIQECLQVQAGETVLIATNPAEEVAAISRALYAAAERAGARPVMIVQPRKTQLEFAEESAYAALAAGPDIFISITEEKLGRDRKATLNPYRHGSKHYDSGFHYLLFGKKSLRAFWSPKVTREIFATTVPIDYGELRRRCALLLPLLDEAEGVEVRSPGSGVAGCELYVGLAGRKAKADDGDFSRPGSGGNLPAGEVFISPALGSAEGRIVFDGSVASTQGVILVQEPIDVEVKEGFVTEVRGGAEADALRANLAGASERARILEAEGKLPGGQGEIYARNSGNLGELGIGLNTRAAIMGTMLNDEKVYGTCHLAIGYNYDEDAPALIHLDGLIKSPTITLVMPGGRRLVVMEGGSLSAQPGTAAG